MCVLIQPENFKMRLCSLISLLFWGIFLTAKACKPSDPNLQRLRSSKLLRLSTNLSPNKTEKIATDVERFFADLVSKDKSCMSKVPALPKQRKGPMATTFESQNGEQRLMVCGGYLPDSAQIGRECWSISDNLPIWRPEENLPLSTFEGSGMASINSSVYVVGGLFNDMSGNIVIRMVGKSFTALTFQARKMIYTEDIALFRGKTLYTQ